MHCCVTTPAYVYDWELISFLFLTLDFLQAHVVDGRKNRKQSGPMQTTSLEIRALGWHTTRGGAHGHARDTEEDWVRGPPGRYSTVLYYSIQTRQTGDFTRK